MGQKIHAHNDYQRPIPLYTAFGAGSESIEIDIVLDRNELFVAHEKRNIQPDKTLKNSYLIPLQLLQKQFPKRLGNMQLLIDIKTDAIASLHLLVRQLEAFPKLWAQGLKVVISGDQPEVALFHQYPNYMYFDYQGDQVLNRKQLQKVGLMSKSFRDFSNWNGKGLLPKQEKQQLLQYIEKVHLLGKSVRFWATPDSKTSWQTLLDLGVDYINTDTPMALREYLDHLQSNRAINKQTYTIVNLKEEKENDNGAISIILCIGDGMGLSALSAATAANKQQLYITNMPNIGLIRTQAADAFCTDSAAAATAFATGVQTNNRAIGVDPSGTVQLNLTEFLASQGYKNAIVTSDAISGATPAAFYAHVVDRDNETQILQQLATSSIDYFISRGQQSHLKYKALQQKYSQWETQPTGKPRMRMTYFQERESLKKQLEATLKVLDTTKKPFFLMLEGAKIDSYGHSNQLAPMLEAIWSFDMAVGAAIQYAEKNPNTLVLVTADHETGGLSILDGNIHSSEVLGHFSTTDHTATMVPIFAYGNGAQSFMGVYANKDIFTKIKDLVLGKGL
ncbi:MAG: alkaline phosphatase [Flavobacteriaceae bacterium]|nr:alkaline phosphatase [Flavobacteriaceae bacterium]